MEKSAHNKHTRSNLKSLLADRDQEISFLRSQLHVRIEHNAHLEARLLTTLDTLDQIQASTALDYRQLQEQNVRLARRLHAATALVRAAQQEKDELGAAVLQLVSRIECTNDYTKWNAARIELTRKLSICPKQNEDSVIDPRPPSSCVATKNECACPESYSHSVVKELTSLLTQERKSHAMSIAEAERRITSLEAQVAVRDAVIARRTIMCKCSPERTEADGRLLAILSVDERKKVARETASKNLILGNEVASLRHELQDARYHRLISKRRSSRNSSTSSKDILSAEDGHSEQPYSRKPDSYGPLGDFESLNEQIKDLRVALSDINEQKDMLAGLLLNDGEYPKENNGVNMHQANVPPVDPTDRSLEDILLLEEECISLMRIEERSRGEIDRLRAQEGELVRQNMVLQEKLAQLQEQPATEPENLYNKGAVAIEASLPSSPFLTAHTPPPSDISAIDIAFPPLQPITVPQLSLNTKMSNLVTSHEAVSRLSSPSSSSSSDLHTPASPADPNIVTLPGASSFEETDASDDSIEEFAQVPEAENPLADPNAGRRVDAIAQELAETRAEADAQAREIAELRDAIENVQNIVHNEDGG